jgi:hypothetical protein
VDVATIDRWKGKHPEFAGCDGTLDGIRRDIIVPGVRGIGPRSLGRHRLAKVNPSKTPRRDIFRVSIGLTSKFRDTTL